MLIKSTASVRPTPNMSRPTLFMGALSTNGSSLAKRNQQRVYIYQCDCSNWKARRRIDLDSTVLSVTSTVADRGKEQILLPSPFRSAVIS